MSDVGIMRVCTTKLATYAKARNDRKTVANHKTFNDRMDNYFTEYSKPLMPRVNKLRQVVICPK